MRNRSYCIKPFSIVIISFLGILAYSDTFSCSFHFDDIPYIVENLYIRNIHDLQNIWHWWPCRFITFLSFAVNYHFGQLNVFGYHLFNLAVHLISATLVWWLVDETLATPAMREEKISRHAGIISLLCGLVFVTHPLQTQAVTFIWQRAASMAAMFYMASLCFYVHSRLLHEKDPSVWTGRWCYIFSLITAIAAMFTKENAITLPLMVLLYEFIFFKTKRDLNWKPIVPFLLILLVIPLTWILSGAEKIQSRHSFIPNISSMHYLLTEFRVILTYLRLVFLPLHQNLDYDYSFSKSFFEVPVFLSFLSLAGILFFARRMYAKYRLVSFSIFWFFLTLLPESSFFHFGDVIFEHRLYLPLAGYSLFLVSGMYYLTGKNSIKAMTAILLMVIIGNAVLTYQRNKVWKDELSLWTDIVTKSPHKARPYNSLGLIYDSRGDSARALIDYDKAIEIFPYYVDAYNNRGLLYYKRGDLSSALSDYNKAIAIKPDLANVYNNRGIIYAQQGNFTRAMLDYDRCIELSPTYARAYVNRGMIWAQEGDPFKALTDYNKAIEINPRIPQSYVLRAVVYFKLKEFDHAWDDVHQARALGVAVSPDFIGALEEASGGEK